MPTGRQVFCELFTASSHSEKPLQAFFMVEGNGNRTSITDGIVKNEHWVPQRKGTSVIILTCREDQEEEIRQKLLANDGVYRFMFDQDDDWTVIDEHITPVLRGYMTKKAISDHLDTLQTAAQTSSVTMDEFEEILQEHIRLFREFKEAADKVPDKIKNDDKTSEESSIAELIRKLAHTDGVQVIRA